jgi:hypothetical protein
VCDEEWRLSPASQAIIAEFLRRVNEELAFLAQGGAPAPGGGSAPRPDVGRPPGGRAAGYPPTLPAPQAP